LATDNFRAIDPKDYSGFGVNRVYLYATSPFVASLLERAGRVTWAASLP
jgi:hypothetical protein